jgi:long-chain acyl-CoA synthetase
VCPTTTGASVVGDDAVTAELLDYARRRLAKFKLPRSIDYIAEMPRDPNGKLYKRILRDPYWAGREARI